MAESRPEDQATPLKRISMFPFRVPEEFLVKSLLTQTLPWQSPAMMGATGTTTSQPDVTSYLVAFEWPIHQLALSSPMTQQDLERLHLNRFFTDYVMGTGQVPFTDLAQTEVGSDPPDFTVQTGEGREGIDCAQITISARRNVNAAFGVIRDALLREPRERFAHLIGHVVYMWFGGGKNDLGLPPRPGNKREIRAILDALASYRIDPDAFTYQPDHVNDGLPETLKDVPFETSLPGTTFYAMPMKNATPASLFFHLTGFEIGMSFPTMAYIAEVWGDLRRIVRKHDKPKTAHLVVTVGGPNQGGFAFPVETFLLDAALNESVPLDRLRHLKSVTLHFWQTGRIVSLHPSFAATSPIYPGQFSAAFFSAAVTPSDSPVSSFEWLFFRPTEDEPSREDESQGTNPKRRT